RDSGEGIAELSLDPGCGNLMLGASRRGALFRKAPPRRAAGSRLGKEANLTTVAGFLSAEEIAPGTSLPFSATRLLMNSSDILRVLGATMPRVSGVFTRSVLRALGWRLI